MRRLAHSVRKDAVLQFRGGLYVVGGLVALFYIGLLRQIPDGWLVNLPLLIPATLAVNVLITTFYFIAALVLLETSEGTLAALATSPLRAGEYLGAKVISLTILAIAENALILGVFYGVDFDPWKLAAGLASLCAFYTLVGFVTISRFESINAYLIPSGFLVAALLLPMLTHFGVVETRLMYAHPVQPFLSLLRAAFVPVPALELGYAVIGIVLWMTAAYVGARRAYGRLVVR